MAERIFHDQLGYEVKLPTHSPKRIVSLVPSQTELLFDLGLDEEVVGLTYFCIYPKDKFKEKPKIGGTKKVNLDKVEELNPDLVIANKEENEKDQIDALKEDFPVWVSNVKDLDTALDMITNVSDLVGKAEAGQTLANQIRTGFANLPSIDPRKTLYFIWRNPYMAAAGDTFIHNMLAHMGLDNALKYQKRYPELTIEAIQKFNPELIFLSSEPYPFKERHIQELKDIVPHADIRLVDGSMFSWYGSRMLKAVNYFQHLMENNFDPVATD